MKNLLLKRKYLNVVGAILLSLSLFTACGEKVQQTSAIPVAPTATPSPTPTVTSKPTTTPTQTVQPTSTPKPTVKPTPAPEVKKDTIVYITRTGAKYHRVGCQYLSKSQIAINLSDANEQYEPCSRCNPPR